jgi:BirA family biotin operon repressor/biotin-[acetyl-CoA-carboxylase] ligase
MKFKPVLHRVESCLSTNDLARRLAGEGAPEGTAVFAGEQTAGRGTKGRSWYSARNKGLYVSVILRPRSPEISLLPLVAGIAAREAIANAHGLDVLLRWPNDLVWRGKKLGGILCESGLLGSEPDFAVIGIGININHQEADFPPDFRALATSLSIATGKNGNPESIVPELLESLATWYDVFCRGERRAIIDSFEAHSALHKGDGIQVLVDERLFSGNYQGLDPDGSLLFEDQTGCHRFHSAEVLKIL